MTTPLTTSQPIADAIPVPGKKAGVWPWVMTFIRLPLMLLGLIVGWLFLTLTGNAQPWSTAISLTNVLFTLFVDGICLGLLLWRAREENFRFADLINFDRARLWKDILSGLGWFIVLTILFQISTIVSMLIVYGPSIFNPQTTTHSGFQMPPVWVFWWSATIFPIAVGFIEEMTYRAYALPRLEAATQNRWTALLIMSFGFALQHVALPLVDWQTSLTRFLGMLPFGLILGLIYLKSRRLMPLIIAHWALDFVFIGIFPLLAILHS